MACGNDRRVTASAGRINRVEGGKRDACNSKQTGHVRHDGAGATESPRDDRCLKPQSLRGGVDHEIHLGKPTNIGLY